MTLCCIMGIVGASVLGGGNEIQDIVISNDLISDTFFYSNELHSKCVCKQ